MSYVPLNHSVFFDRLGAKFVQAALINGEFFGETKDRAQIWLQHHKDSQHRKWVVWTIIGTVAVGLIGAAATLLASLQ